MRAQWKIVLLVLVVVVATLAAVIWKTQSLLMDDRVNFIADSSMKQIAPLKRLVSDKLEEERNRLLAFAARRVATPNSTRPRRFGDFDVIALVRPGSGGQWATTWVEKNAGAEPVKWPAGHEQTLLKSLPYGKTRDGEITWARVSDRQGSPVYAIMVPVEIQNTAAQAVDAAEVNGAGSESGGALPDTTEYAAQAPAAGSGERGVVVGFASRDPLAAVTEDYIGSINTVYLVDDRGYIASHVNKAYLGSLFTEDPLVQDIVRSRKTASTGQYEDLESRPVLGHFEKIDKTNLYAAITTPMQAATGLLDTHFRTAAVTGLLASLIGLLLAYLYGRRLTGEIAREVAVESHAAPMAAMPEIVNPAPSPMAAAVVPAPLIATQSQAEEKTPEQREVERRAAIARFSSGFSQAVREPTMAILGHAQLIRVKSEDEEVRSHSESIEREARRTKEILDRVEEWSGDRAPAVVKGSEKVNLREVIESVINRMRDDLTDEGINITMDLNEVPRISATSVEMDQAVTHIIENAREAMFARLGKRLGIKLDYVNDRIRLEISDSGVGMSRDVRERAFDPFFKDFESPKRMGLGLSFVQSITNRLGGRAVIDAIPGEGSTVRLELPVTSDEKILYREAEAKQLASELIAGSGVSVPTSEPGVAPVAMTSAAQAEEATTGRSHAGEIADIDTVDFFEAMDVPQSNAKETAKNKPVSDSLAKDSSPISFIDDDDDEDEVFTSVPLNRTLTKQEPAPEAPSVRTEVEEFKVRIRRPKKRMDADKDV